MPVLNITDGMVPTAAQINANWRDQVISTVTSGTRPAGTEGQHIYETDTDLIYGYNGGWIPNGGLGLWTSYTPSLIQSGAVTKTVTYARYQKHGRQVIVNIYLAVTGAGTANNKIEVGLPFASATTGMWYSGSGIVYDASTTTIHPGFVALPASTTTVSLTDSTAATTVGTYQGQTGASFSVALASGDVIAFGVIYEAATEEVVMPEVTIADELAELRAQVEALTAAQQPVLPEVVPNWEIRTCQVCGALAEVIDTDPESRKVTRNGEGYCLTHAKKAGVLKGEHLKR